MSEHLGQSDASVARCTTCGTPLVEDKALDDAKRFFEPYHECVSWTYMPPERAEEALLVIRKRLKQAVGWWHDGDQQLEDQAKKRLGIEREL